jgi:hypothetical protein
MNTPDPTSRCMALGLTPLLREKGTRNLPDGKARPERKANNLTVIYEPIL